MGGEEVCGWFPQALVGRPTSPFTAGTIIINTIIGVTKKGRKERRKEEKKE